MATIIKMTDPVNPIYKSFEGVLKNAEMGKVVTRFPPEPSGYLHIGHAKASLLNYHYAKMYNGKMIIRFDDTNPSKESTVFVDQILKDLKTLEIYPDKIEFASDFHPIVEGFMTFLIQRGICYAEGQPAEEVKEQRDKGMESPFREATVDENMARWGEMLKGTPLGKTFCIRARLNMKNKVKCLRDPVLYRCNEIPHHRTGTRFCAYPTYDFSCPIVDSLEGVTHALRSIEYRDRLQLYTWVQEVCGLRQGNVYEFSRVSFKHTLMSKRKLQKLVDQGMVEGWMDPRFPTVQGIMRRGMTVRALTEFMLGLGPSKNNNFMEWDKIWALNKKILDPVTPRYTAIEKDRICHLYINGVPEVEGDTPFVRNQPLHPKNEELGEKPVLYFSHVLVDFGDLEEVKVGDKLTLMKWGNVKITERNVNPSNPEEIIAYGEYLADDKDFKNTVKVNWLASVDDALFEFKIVEFSHIITKPKPEENDTLEDIVNPESKAEYRAVGEGLLKSLKEGDKIQLERRGFYFVDKQYMGPGTDLVLHFIPDGKSQAMSRLKPKMDAKFLAKGLEKPEGGAKEEQAKGGDAVAEEVKAEEEPKLSKKELKKLQKKKEKQTKKEAAKTGEKPAGGEEKEGA